MFDDGLYLVFADPDHSVEEHRFTIMGESRRCHLLVAAYTDEGDAIRIATAQRTARDRALTRTL